MNKNTVKKLADNPYYTMNDKELESLANLLHEEAERAKEDEIFAQRKVNKNRVLKTKPTIARTSGLEEQDDVDAR